MKRRTLFLAGLVLLVVIGAGAAFAYWTTHGAGTGTSSSGTLQPVTVDAFVGGDSPSPSFLLPGGSADVILRVKNTNAFAVTLVTVNGGPAAITDNKSGCAGTDLSFASQSSRSDTIAASGTTLVRLTGAATLSTSAANACQGATFFIPVTITVHTS